LKRPRPFPSLIGKDAAAAAGLLILAALVFSRVLFGPEVFWQRDISFYWYPQVASFVRVVAGGAWPLWNPYFSFGLPLLADPSNQIAYPLTWANLLLPPAIYYKGYVLIHVVAAGTGLFLLMRSWGYERWPSFAAGGAWILSGPLLVVVSHTHHLAGTAWLPWVLLALNRALRSGTARAMFALGAAAAGQVLAGSGDLCLMSAFAGLGCVLLFVTEGGRSGLGEKLRRSLRVGSIAAVLAGLLSAPQWLPTLAFLGSGQRLHLQRSFNMAWSLHPASLIDLVVPRLVSDLPLTASARAALFEGREPLFACIYLGAGPAALVALTLAAPWRRFARFSALAFALAIITSLGKYTPFYAAALAITPLRLFRYPSKYLILAGLFWAVLVGQGVEGVQHLESRDGDARRSWRVGIIAAAALAAVLLVAALVVAHGPRILLGATSASGGGRTAMVGLAAVKVARSCAIAAIVAALGWLRSRRALGGWLSVVLVALVFGDLLPIGSAVNPVGPPELLKSTPALLAQIRPGARIWVQPTAVDDAEGGVVGPAGWDRGWSLVRSTNELLRPPTAARWGLRGSYDGDFTGLAPPLLSNMTLIMEHAARSALGVRVLQMAGVDYVVTLDDWPFLPLQAQEPAVFRRPIRLYGVPGALPRTYVVGRARVAAEPRSVETIGDPGFDPTSEIIVPPGAASMSSNGGSGSRLRELWRRADAFEVEVDSSGPAYAVALQTYEPGWRARVDGRPAPVVRANVLFQAVAVPAGRHRVEFQYRPASVAWGLLLAAIGCALGGIVYRVTTLEP
jgi:Bacterial membrane protein YfhO